MAVERYRHRPTGGYSCSGGARPSGVKVSAERKGALIAKHISCWPQTRSRLPLPIVGGGGGRTEARHFGRLRNVENVVYPLFFFGATDDRKRFVQKACLKRPVTGDEITDPTFSSFNARRFAKPSSPPRGDKFSWRAHTQLGAYRVMIATGCHVRGSVGVEGVQGARVGGAPRERETRLSSSRARACVKSRRGPWPSTPPSAWR